MNYKRLFLVLIVIFLSTLEIYAGGKERAGTSGAAELLIPVGAKGTALGGSSISSISGVDALFWNPAGISGMSASAEVMFSSMNYIGDVGVSSMGLVANFAGFGTIGFSLKALSFGDIPLTTELAPDNTGLMFSPTYMTLGVTYSKALSDRVRAGITINFVNEKIDQVSASGIGFDVGVQYFGLGGVNGLKIGLTAKNLGPQMKFDGGGLYRWATPNESDRTIPSLLKVETAGFELPSYFELAVGYEMNIMNDHKFNFATSFQNNNFLDDEYKLSVEYGFKDMFFVRGSYQMVSSDPNKDYLYGPAFGAGVHYATGGLDLTLDYAYRSNNVFDASNVISLKVGF